METTREHGLLAWQWSLYPRGHRNRLNLTVHALTEPLFVLGTCAVLLAPILGAWSLAVLGVAGMVTTVILQGRTHKLERSPPAPFLGPLDVVARLFLEQWITFPRYVLSGEFARAWRDG